MKSETPIIVKDNKNQKHILIQVNLRKSNTQVISNFSAWENLALIMEALGATSQQCLSEGYSREKIMDEIDKYLEKVLKGYGIQGD